MESLAAEEYEDLEQVLRGYFGQEFDIPSIKVRRAPEEKDPFGAEYDREAEETILFAGTDGSATALLEAYNRKPYSRLQWELRTKNRIVHETAHGYLYFLSDKHGINIWRWAPQSDEGGMRMIWKTVVEGVATVVSEDIMGVQTYIPDIDESSVLDMPSERRQAHLRHFPYAAGRELFHDLYERYGLALLDVIVTTPVSKKDWFDLPGYRERIRERAAEALSGR